MDSLERRSRRSGRVAIGAWVVGGASFVLLALPDVNADARGLVVGAAILSAIAGAFAAWRYPTHRAVGGLALVLSGLTMPTFAAVWINLVPVGAGTYLVVSRRRTATRSR